MIDPDIARAKLENLMRDPTGELGALALRLDCIDGEISGLQRIRHAEMKARLDALGIDTSRFREPPPIHRSEQRSTMHVSASDDIGELVTAAQESALDRLAREHLGDTEPMPEPAPLIRRYFETEITIR